jgi:BNR repeat-like domain
LHWATWLYFTNNCTGEFSTVPLRPSKRTQRNIDHSNCCIAAIFEKLRLGMFLLSTVFGNASAFPAEPELQHVEVYSEAGRFGGWPANHGSWCWGNEILVGFSAGYHKDLGNERHNIDREKPEEHLLARSLDGGVTWSLENPATQGALIPAGKALHGIAPPELTEKPWLDCPGGINFAHPDFAMTIRMIDNHHGPSRFHYSYDRGRTWQGPFRLPDVGTPGIAARTDYIVHSQNECLLFVTAGKSDGREGRPLCMRTKNGGKSWEFVGWIGDEPRGYAIMPATVALENGDLLSAIRCRDPSRAWIDVYRSTDLGQNWKLDSTPAPSLGEGNPASLTRLKDGSVCLTYGFRAKPFSIRARISRDQGRTWGDERILRTYGGGRDVGYPRTVQRSDGKLVTIYYFHDQPASYRYIAATIWSD